MEFEFILLSPSLVWSTLLGPFPDNVACACTNIQQVAEEEEEEGDTPHNINTWCNATVWVDFFDGLH